MKRDYLEMNDLSPAEMLDVFRETAELKKQRRAGALSKALEGKSLGMIFDKHSTRTRISFEVAMYELGGHPLFLSSGQLQLNRGETVEDSARVLSRYLSALLVRTYAHEQVAALARHASIPVINGLTDRSHPAQVLTDIFTIQEKLGRIEGVKVAYVGDGNNVAYSWIVGASLLGMHLAVAAPPELKPALPAEMGAAGKIEIVDDPFAAARGADVLYTDVWVSMGEEKKAAEKIALLKNYQINAQLLAAAKPSAIVMHCLPAHRGEEITGDVMDGRHSVIFDQAENRLHTQKALLLKLLR